MIFFLKAKHWQIFLVLLFGLFNSNFTYVGEPTITVVVRVLGLLIYFSWILFVGHGLYDFLPKKINLNYNLFIINFFIWLTAYSIIIIVSDGEGMTFDGIAAIPMLYVGFAFLHIMIFPGRLIKSIELGEKADFGEYIGNFFLLLFWPIGIWFLQPRINRIVTDHIAKDKK